MQPVRKRPERGRRKKTLIIIAVTLSVIAGLVLVLRFIDSRSKTPPPAARTKVPKQVQLVNRHLQDLAAFQVFPPGRESYRLVRDDNTFFVDGKPGFPLEEHMLSPMIEDLTSLSAEKAGDISEVLGGPGALGMDGGHFRVLAEYRDGSQLTFSFGHSAPTDIPSDYLMISGDSGVYIVSPQIRSNLDHPLGALHPIPRINFSGELLDSMQVSDNNDAFSLAYSTALWQVTAPFQYPANPGAIAALKKNINSMLLAVYVGEAAELKLENYGLLSPVRTVVFNLAESIIITPAQDDTPGKTRQVPAQSLSFALGDDIDNIGFYCLYQGSVYQASYASMGFLTALSLDAFLADSPVVIPINQLNTFKVKRSGEERHYQIELVERVEKNNTLAFDAAGRQIYDPVIMLDGHEINAEGFIREYLKLMDVGNRGKLRPGYKPEGTPVIQYTLEAEGSKLDLAFYPYDALHLAMSVNGQALYYTAKQAVEDISFQ